jgi:CBS domain-containing protein
MAVKAKDIMSKNVITVHKEATIKEIAKVLVDNDISGVPVVDDDGSLVGMVSEGDLLYKETTPRPPDYVNILGAIIYYNGVQRYNEDFKKMMAEQAGAIMTSKVVSISEDEEVDGIAKLMIAHGIKRIPVMQAKKIVGIISRADLVKLLLN